MEEKTILQLKELQLLQYIETCQIKIACCVLEIPSLYYYETENHHLTKVSVITVRLNQHTHLQRVLAKKLQLQFRHSHETWLTVFSASPIQYLLAKDDLNCQNTQLPLYSAYSAIASEDCIIIFTTITVAVATAV